VIHREPSDREVEQTDRSDRTAPLEFGQLISRPALAEALVGFLAEFVEVPTMLARLIEMLAHLAESTLSLRRSSFLSAGR
jgi:hypothetical protein